MINNMFTTEQFLESKLLDSFNPTIQELLSSLIQKLQSRNLDFVIVKRNEPVIVFKVAAMYYNKQSSQCNIVTIRFPEKQSLQLEPYEDNDSTCYTYTSSATLDDNIINKIESIYKRKIEKFYSKNKLI